MKFKCEKCGTRYTIADEKVRSRVLKIRCKVCEHVITVRDPDAPAAVETPGPGATRGATSSRAPSAGHAPLGDMMSRDRTSAAFTPAPDVEWYCAPETGQQGPMPLERLRDMIRAGDVKPDDFVWNETMSDWLPANSVTTLNDLFRPKLPRPPVRPPVPGSNAPPIERHGDSIISAHPINPRLSGGPRSAPPSMPPDATREEAMVIPSRASLAPAPRADLDVDLLSLLGPTPGQMPVESSPTELMPSSRAPTRPVESDELAALMAAELAAPPTAASPSLSRDLSAAPTRAGSAVSGGGKATVPAKAKTAETNFGFDELHELPTSLPASPSGVQAAIPSAPVRTGVPLGVVVAVGLVLVAGGIGLGIWLAPKGTSEPPPPQVGATTNAPAQPPTLPPSAAPTEPPAAASAQAANPPSAEASAPASENPAGATGGTLAGEKVAAVVRGTPGRLNTGGAAPASAQPSRPSAFAGLDAARGGNTPSLAPKNVGKGASLPPGLDQVEISAVIKRNIKAVQACYQRQLKRDDTMADGRATIRFRITGDGRAKDVDMDRRFNGTVLKQCIVNTVERWAFPPFEGDPIPVEFPVIFTATF